MCNRNIKDYIVSVPMQYKSADLDGEIKPDQYRYNKLFPGDKIFIFDTERKCRKRELLSEKTDQPNHIKPDHTTPISLYLFHLKMQI